MRSKIERDGLGLVTLLARPLLVLLLFATSEVFAGKTVLTPCRFTLLAPMPNAAISLFEKQNVEEGTRALQIGLSRALENPIVVNRTTVMPEQWSISGDGWRSFSLQVGSAGALGLRVHFENVALPTTAELRFSDPARPDAVPLVVEASAFAGQGDYWSPTLFSEQTSIECRVPPGVDVATVSFTVSGVSHIYKTPTASNFQKAGDCENDISCYPEYAQQAAGVALMTYVVNGNTFLCSGCVLAPAKATSDEYFLTARHCINNQSQASTLEFYWLFQTDSCNGTPPLMTSVPTTKGGADLLATGVSDFAFLKLRAPTPAGVVAQDWTITPPNTSEILGCIHHPDGTFKRGSFGVYLGSNPYFLAIQWATGVTEDGSSGAPLFNGNHLVVGQLTGGFDGPGSSCADPSALDQFGRFDVTYTFIRKWIDPDGIKGGPPPVNGTYHGLFYIESAPGVAGTCGTVAITTTSKGQFTGKLQLGAGMLSFKGFLNANGVGDAVIKRQKLSPLSLEFQVNLADGATALTGLLTDGDWTAVVSADRAVFDGKTNSSPQMGQYTMLIPSSGGAAPGGNSFGVAQVDKNGRIRIVASLADGTKASQSTYVSANGRWPMYFPLYHGEGTMMSWVQFASADSSDLTGHIYWNKPPEMSGFVTEADMSGSMYQKPAKGASVLNFTAGVAQFNGGELSQGIQGNITLQPNGKVQNQSGLKLSLSILPATGLMTGKLVDPDSKASLTIRGVAIQKQNIASGYFGGTNQSGQILIQSQ